MTDDPSLDEENIEEVIADAYYMATEATHGIVDTLVDKIEAMDERIKANALAANALFDVALSLVFREAMDTHEGDRVRALHDLDAFLAENVPQFVKIIAPCIGETN